MIDGPDRPYDDRKRAGAWYTPPDLAERMVGRALELADGPVRTVLDPFAGGGVFLEAAAGRGLAAYGVDTDPRAVGACRAAVPAARVVAGDSLLAPCHGGLDWAAEFPEVFGPARATGWRPGGGPVSAAASGEDEPPGGFDLVAGNPPWEVVERSVHAPHGAADAYARLIRASGYRFQQASSGGGGKINLYRVAVERSFSLLRPGGVLAFLVPAGLLRDAGGAALRGHLLAAGAWAEVWEFGTGRDLFPTAHRDLPVCAVFVRRGGPTRRIRLAGGEELDRRWLARFSPRDSALPALRRPGEAALLRRLMAHPPLADSVRGIRKGDVNLATYRSLFTGIPTPLALRTGKEIAPYRVVTPPSRWVAPERLVRRARPWEHPRVAWRDIADLTLRKRMCAAPLPAGAVLGDTLNFLVPPYDCTEAGYWLAVLNSHVFEWSVRLRSAHNHLGGTVVGACPAPPFEPGNPLCRELAAAAWSAAESPSAEIRTDSLAARRFGLAPADLDLVLAAFPKQPAAVTQAFRSAFARGPF